MAAPYGNRNAAKARDWADALKWQLDNYEGKGIAKGQALRAIAFQVIERALDGDQKAVEEIANRLDGRPAQAMTLSGDSEFPIQTILNVRGPDSPVGA